METYTIKEIVEKFGISENEMKYLMRKRQKIRIRSNEWVGFV